MRLDKYLVLHHGFTRNKAQALIDAGLIVIDGKIILKASSEVSENSIITITPDKKIDYVSRSAGKLDGFLDQLSESQWMLNEKLEVFLQAPIIENALCLDVGSSTGGFTQILLERWAKKVIAVDVGSDQLHPSLRSHNKVELYEQTDIRDFTYKESFDIITIDVSFISLREIFPHLSRCMKEDARIFALYKPQFEVGKENLRKTGVPKNENIILQKLEEFRNFSKWIWLNIIYDSKSIVIGEAGNQEYMFLLSLSQEYTKK
jgi:23S rRNA (cytidine1920-2'-O)/16S rRNA (cytidine1409-2'-O)-methyltransferase